MPTAIRRFVRSLDLDAYVVGGAVRDELLGVAHADEDFLVPGVDQARLRALLEPHGRVEEMEVHGQLVGVRLHPLDRTVRALVPAGIELTPPRAERSTGPGHRHFAIVSDPSIGIEEDMARRDFTVNAMAIRLADGSLTDPFGGLGDLARRRLRTVAPGSFAEDPLRLLRAVRFVSQLGLEPTGETVTQMRLGAAGLEHVSPERIGGGLAADGMGELSKLLLGRAPARALRLALETGLLGYVIPELRGMAPHASRFRLVQVAADAGEPLAVRLAALLAEPELPAGEEARLARTALERLRYPVRLQRRVEEIVRGRAFPLTGPVGPLEARRFLARHGEELAHDLAGLRAAELAVAAASGEGRETIEALRALLVEERAQPYRLSDLAVRGDDLIALGIPEGPELGRILGVLLDEVVDDPDANERELLLARATRELSR